VYRFDRPDDIHGEIGEGAGCRVGITVSKKLGGAVERNRLKRQLWEAIDRCGVLPEGYDLVVIARPGLPDAIASNGFDWLVELVAEQVEKLISNDGQSVWAGQVGLRQVLMSARQAIRWASVAPVLALIFAYRRLISPFLAPRCRYYPTCSAYAAQALRERGVIAGVWLADRERSSL